VIRRLFRSGEADTDRIEAFSDGVLAIVITLLVLEITPPSVQGGDAELWRALARMLPVIAAWVVSFLFVLVFWVSYQPTQRLTHAHARCATESIRSRSPIRNSQASLHAATMAS